MLVWPLQIFRPLSIFRTSPHHLVTMSSTDTALSRELCTESTGVSTLSDHSVILPVSLITRLSVIISEGVVVVVTWITTFRQARLDVKMDMRSLSTTLLRDGKEYCLPFYI